MATWVRIRTCDESPLYVVDTCAGGKWSRDVKEAKWWHTAAEAFAELEATDIDAGRLLPEEFIQCSNS